MFNLKLEWRPIAENQENTWSSSDEEDLRKARSDYPWMRFQSRMVSAWTDENETNDRLAALLDTPMVDWRHNVMEVKPEQRAHMVRTLDGFIETACRLRAYVENTTGERDTDAQHDRAVRRSNGLATKIRRALGYSQPRADVRF